MGLGHAGAGWGVGGVSHPWLPPSFSHGRSAEVPCSLGLPEGSSSYAWPKAFAYDKFAERKPGFDKDQGLLTLHDYPFPHYLYAQLNV